MQPDPGISRLRLNPAFADGSVCEWRVMMRASHDSQWALEQALLASQFGTQRTSGAEAMGAMRQVIRFLIHLSAPLAMCSFHTRFCFQNRNQGLLGRG